MPSRKLNDIAPECRSIFFELLARCSEVGIPVYVVDTLRSSQEQAENIKKGVSWTTNSKHLPQPPSGLSYAIDICPYEIYNLHGPDKLQWNNSEPAWQVLGKIGESLGLRWGGRWQKKDMGHFEYLQKSVIRTT
jgi:peptidoglycan LD-endopeptidase CwlK